MLFLITPRRRTFSVAVCLLLLLVIGSVATNRQVQAAGIQQNFFGQLIEFTQRAQHSFTGWRNKSSNNTTTSAPVAAPVFAAFTVTNTNDSGAGSLREAILDANATAGADTIDFALGTGFPTITLLSALPTISDPVIINGNTGGATLVRIDGISAGAGVSGLTITAGNSTVRRMLITRFTGNGIFLVTNGGNSVLGCAVGVDSTGTIDLGNGANGILISSSPNNTIGGLIATERNVISGNDTNGVFIAGTAATGNKITGNYIGPSLSGTADLGNTLSGVFINNAPGNTIGGTTAGERNIISGNNNYGVYIANVGSSANKVIGNYIGTAVNGTTALGNSLAGVLVNGAPNNTIGGTTPGERNVISGNLSDGVVLTGTGSAGNKVIGNYIGTTVTGAIALGNRFSGVYVSAPSNTIGGTTTGERNIISGNNGQGVILTGTTATGNKIIGNHIGTDVTGTVDLGNAFEGVATNGAPNNTVGGTTSGERNIISGNQIGVSVGGTGSTGNKIIGNFIGTDFTGNLDLSNDRWGVLIYAGASNNTIGGTTGEGNIIAGNDLAGVSVESNSTGNKILSNSIFNNLGLGIDLGAVGVTANDGLDLDTGANNLQNFPVLVCAVSGNGTTRIQGTFNSLPVTKFRIEFFVNDTCDASGNGEGQTFIGFTNLTTDTNGDAPISTTIAQAFAAGKFITATATKLDALNNPVETSEFSACKAVLAPTLSISDVAVVEGNSGTTNAVFTVTLSGAMGSCIFVTVNYATADGTATLANGDYANTAGTLVFNPPHSSNSITQTITVPVTGDVNIEPNEAFVINLSNPANATITDAQGVGTITNDDTAPTITTALFSPLTRQQGSAATNATIATVTDAETAAGSLIVTPITLPAGITVTSIVNANGTITANVAAACTATLGNNTVVLQVSDGSLTSTANLIVNVTPHNLALTALSNQTVFAGTNVIFSATASGGGTYTFVWKKGAAIISSGITTSGATSTLTLTAVQMADAGSYSVEVIGVCATVTQSATLTVTTPTLSINDVSVTEGNSGTVNAVFTVSLNNASPVPVTVQYKTSNNTATMPIDYVGLPLSTLTFNPGEQNKTVTVAVKGETVIELTETFFVDLSNATNATIADAQGLGTITNDDFPTIAINDVMVTEGNSGTVNATFTVSLSEASPDTITVVYQTANSLALAGSDYTTASNTLIFAPGEISKSILVPVISELEIEPDETFFVNLSSSVNATIADGQGIGTIKDDDYMRELSADISDPIECTGVENILSVHAEIANPNDINVSFNFEATLPSQLIGIAGTCVVTSGNCTVNANNVVVTGVMTPRQMISISYKVQVAPNTPIGTELCVSSKVILENTVMGTVLACTKLECPTTIAEVGVSDQKVGSVLVFPYYTSSSESQKDTQLSVSNVGESEAIVHLFFIDGTNCNQADFFVCLTPNAKITFNVSEYDPETTGWVMAVAVNRDGVPVQNNVLIGNAFVKDGMYVDNYGAESFWANSASVAAINGDKATLYFDGGGYDAIPRELTAEIQSPLDAIGQKIVTVGMRGDLTESGLTGAGQTGVGLAYNAQERGVSYSNFLTGNCFATATITGTSPRVPGTMNGLIAKGNSGTLRFSIGAGVGLLMTPKTAKWSGIRGLHKTKLTTSTITIPVLKPHC
jgi:Calx-beta domain/Immunoglobulin I-set domain